MKKKTHNQIIHVSDTHVIIRLHTNETLNIPINDLTFHPKENDIVEVYQNQNQIVIYPVLQNNKKWIVIALISLLFLIIIGTTFLLFNNSNSNTEIIENHSSPQISSTSSSSSSSSSTSSSSTSSTTSAMETSIIDTTAEELRDMENDGTLKTGQLYRFTTKLIRQEYWEEYSGHFKTLNTYHTIWVKASNAPMTGVQVQIKKSMIEGWKEGATVTFTVKIMEDSEKFQFWVTTDATLITTPTEEKHTETEPLKLDSQAILQGDYSSIAGTWRNGFGEEIAFDKSGLVNGEIITIPTIGNQGVISFSMRLDSVKGGIMIYPPKSTVITRSGDSSDKNQIRIMVIKDAPRSSKEAYYYVGK